VPGVSLVRFLSAQEMNSDSMPKVGAEMAVWEFCVTFSTQSNRLLDSLEKND
jgi:hypothetical protein